MSVPSVVTVASGSPAARAGLQEGDEILSVNGEVPRDVIEWRLLVDEPELALETRRGGLEMEVDLHKEPGEPLGVEVQSALFDRVRTCDNHCEFCFIYQLPPGLRRSLYLKDDDYRLSFLYGNFTTLTRFTEADLERVVTEGLGPLYVSIHATDPNVRSEMLRNRRGATSLRWLRALLDHGVEVHGQVVLCPGVNGGPVLEDTLLGVLDRYPELATLCVVPLGVSRYNTEARMRPHTAAEAAAVLVTVHDWQQVFRSVLGRRLVFAADEYYLLAGQPFPPVDEYEGFPMHEDGVGMARTFEAEVFGEVPGDVAAGDEGEMSGGPGDHGADLNRDRGGFFRWADGADGQPRSQARRFGRSGQNGDPGGAGRATPSGRSGQARGPATDVSPCSVTEYEPYRAPRTLDSPDGLHDPAGHLGVSAASGHDSVRAAGGHGTCVDGPDSPETLTRREQSQQRLHIRPSRSAPVAILTAPYGARVLQPLLDQLDQSDVRLVVVDNRYFGGNIAVTGLMVGEDLSRALASEPPGHRYLLPDVCLTQGRFLDGSEPADLPHPVEIVPADGTGLRQALGVG